MQVAYLVKIFLPGMVQFLTNSDCGELLTLFHTRATNANMKSDRHKISQENIMFLEKYNGWPFDAFRIGLVVR